jgi:hypothetical protein
LGLAELRCGVHLGLEERERLLGRSMRPRTERQCLLCEAAGQPGLVEDTHHMIFLVSCTTACVLPTRPFSHQARSPPWDPFWQPPPPHTPVLPAPAGGAGGQPAVWPPRLFVCFKYFFIACAYGGRTAYRWARLCTPCSTVALLLTFFCSTPQHPPFSHLTLPYACVVALFFFPVFPVRGHPGTRYHLS